MDRERERKSFSLFGQIIATHQPAEESPQNALIIQVLGRTSPENTAFPTGNFIFQPCVFRAKSVVGFRDGTVIYLDLSSAPPLPFSPKDSVTKMEVLTYVSCMLLAYVRETPTPHPQKSLIRYSTSILGT